MANLPNSRISANFLSGKGGAGVQTRVWALFYGTQQYASVRLQASSPLDVHTSNKNNEVIPNSDLITNTNPHYTAINSSSMSFVVYKLFNDFLLINILFKMNHILIKS